MTFGLQITTASGEVVFDSTAAVGGVLADVVSRAASGSPTTVSYPAFAGHTPYSADAGGNFGVGAWDTSLGYPRLTIPATSTPIVIAVFFK
jgi:hypothetical protein